MDLDEIYQNVEPIAIEHTSGPQTQSKSQDEGKDQKRSKQKITLSKKMVSQMFEEMRAITYNFKNVCQCF